VRSELAAEFLRKAFHMLSLVYLAAFHALGWPLAGKLMAGWLAVCLVVETARLKVPAVERVLVAFFEGLIRETERKHFSGIVHTTAGCLIAMLVAGGDTVIVTAAILQLAFADAAAALAGKAWGRTRILGGQKTLEGCAAGFAAGLASALAVSLVELLPTTGWFNDNLTIPFAGAATLRALLRP
jgi:dolichol kinase